MTRTITLREGQDDEVPHFKCSACGKEDIGTGYQQTIRYKDGRLETEGPFCAGCIVGANAEGNSVEKSEGNAPNWTCIQDYGEVPPSDGPF